MNFRALTFAASASLLVGVAQAQSISVEELRALVDERVNSLDPYAELLNDPDPARSLAAMQIMLESGDPDLERMAREFGLLSPNPTVNRAAVESIMAAGPVLSLRFDGSGVKDEDFVETMRNRLAATVGPDKIAFSRLKVGSLDPGKGCFVFASSANYCFVTINSDGVFVESGNTFKARMVIDDSGALSGPATVQYIDDPTPLSIQLID